MESKSNYMLRISGVNKKFENNDEIQSQIDVLEDISFDINENEILSILGPSGCGKTTLLKIMAGLLKTDEGEIKDKNITKGMVFQEDALLPWFNVEHNVEIGLLIQGEAKAIRKQKTKEMLHKVGLDGFEKFYPYQLSGGMKKRVSIARSLVMDSRLILMDEPFGALDAQTRVVMQELLAKISREMKSTVLFITHDIDEAILLADRIYVMSRRPGTIREVIQVGLEGVRDHEILVNPEFLKLKQKIMDMLWQESQEAAKDQ